MLIIMLVTFYTSRVVLDKLGVVDFGIYNVVGGFALMCVFFRSSLANVTQRCLNMALGINDEEEVSLVFCQHQTMYIVMSIVTLVISEIVGLWMLKHVFVIPEERQIAAFWVFQSVVISLILTLLSVVYESSIIAHEDMKIYAYVGIYEGLAKLAVALVLGLSGCDRLILYAILQAFVSSSIIFFYWWFCKRRYNEISFHFLWIGERAKEAFSLIGWNIIGTAVYAINSQGINILLNVFFGPAVNAARGIAFQVNSAVNGFGQNFYTSIRPQLTKSYAAHDYQYMFDLFYSSSKYSVFLMYFICLPVILCINQILGLWLTIVPDYTGVFTILVLIYSLINSLNTPIWSLALTIGKLKWYIIIGSFILLLSFPISFCFLKMGYGPISVFIVNIIIRSLYLPVVMIVLRRYISISFKRYFLEVIFPALAVIIFTGVICTWLSCLLPDTIVGRGVLCVLCVLIITITIFLFGFNRKERNFIKSYLEKMYNEVFMGTNSL